MLISISAEESECITTKGRNIKQSAVDFHLNSTAEKVDGAK